MIIDLLHNKIMANTVSDGFRASVEENLAPKLRELYGEALLELQMYEDYISDGLLKDGFWYYPLSVNIGGVYAVVWIKWDVSDKSKFKDGIPYAYVGEGNIDFIVAEDVPIAFGRVIEERSTHYEGGSVNISVTTDAQGATVLAGKYSQTFVDEMARQITFAIERACGVSGLSDSSIELHLVFAPSTYMEHTSENVTYRRLLISAKNCAPRDFWVKWTRLDSAVAFCVTDNVNSENIRFEIGEDVSHKIREKEYRFLVFGNSDKYRVAMGRKNITEWRELIKRSLKRGELTRTTSELELENHSTEVSDKLSEILEKCGVSIPDVPTSNEPVSADIANEALRMAVLGDMAQEKNADEEIYDGLDEADVNESEESSVLSEAEAEADENEESFAAEAQADVNESEESPVAEESEESDSLRDVAYIENSDAEVKAEPKEPSENSTFVFEEESFELDSDGADGGDIFADEPEQITFSISDEDGEVEIELTAEEKSDAEYLEEIMRVEPVDSEPSYDSGYIAKNFAKAPDEDENEPSTDEAESSFNAIDETENSSDDIDEADETENASYDIEKSDEVENSSDDIEKVDDKTECGEDDGDIEELRESYEEELDGVRELLVRAGAEIERLQAELAEANRSLESEREEHKKTKAFLEFERASLDERKADEEKLLAGVNEARSIAEEEINSRKLAEAEAGRLRAEIESILAERETLRAELESERLARGELEDKLRATERELAEQTELYEKDKRRDKQLFAVAARQASEERRRVAEEFARMESLRMQEEAREETEESFADEEPRKEVDELTVNEEQPPVLLGEIADSPVVIENKTPEELAEERRALALAAARELRLRMEEEAREETEMIARERNEYKSRFSDSDEHSTEGDSPVPNGNENINTSSDDVATEPKEKRPFITFEETENAEDAAIETVSVPDEEQIVYTSKLVRILFRNVVDPAITVKLREMITEALVKFGKESVYMQIKASIQDSTTVVLNFVKIPESENDLLIDIIHYLGNASVGIYKIILE